MKYLIVNADDFGAGRGINRGVVETHLHGVVTSTSLMVTLPLAAEASELAKSLPALDVGLHVDLSSEIPGWEVDLDHPVSCRAAILRQLASFENLVGRRPTHVDTHYNMHRDPRAEPWMVDVAREYGLPLREHSSARYFSNFYGQWDGETHLEHLSVASLVGMLDREVHHGVTELGCHPGYLDPTFHSPYDVERQTELETLCDPAVRRALEERDIRLIGFRDLNNAAAESRAAARA